MSVRGGSTSSGGGGGAVSTVAGRTGDVVLTSSDVSGVSTPATVAAGWLRPSVLGLSDVGHETCPRANLVATNTLTVGTVRLAYFIARRSETVNKITMATGTSAAGATPTLIKYGIYSVAGNGDLTLAGSTASDTTLFGSVSTVYQKTMTSGVALTEGALYAAAVICVSSASAALLYGALSLSALLALSPRQAGSVAAQSDLGASYTAGQVSNVSAIMYALIQP